MEDCVIFPCRRRRSGRWLGLSSASHMYECVLSSRELLLDFFRTVKDHNLKTTSTPSSQLPTHQTSFVAWLKFQISPSTWSRLPASLFTCDLFSLLVVEEGKFPFSLTFLFSENFNLRVLNHSLCSRKTTFPRFVFLPHTTRTSHAQQNLALCNWYCTRLSHRDGKVLKEIFQVDV